jgi:hypothetical protein
MTRGPPSQKLFQLDRAFVGGNGGDTPRFGPDFLQPITILTSTCLVSPSHLLSTRLVPGWYLLGTWLVPG